MSKKPNQAWPELQIQHAIKFALIIQRFLNDFSWNAHFACHAQFVR
jgi:hypothetical protein